MTELRPTKNRLIVRLQAPETTVGRIILHGDMVERNDKGEVIAVGPKCDPNIFVGATVIFNRMANEELPDGCLLLNDHDCYAVLNG